jgi:hypothetical protein
MQLELLPLKAGTNGTEARASRQSERLRILRVPLYDTDGDTGTQWKTVEMAIGEAMETAHTTCLGHALSLICVHYLAMAGARTDAVHLLAPFERLLGVRIVITDRDASQVLYGTPTLEALALGWESRDSGDNHDADGSGESRADELALTHDSRRGIDG